MATRNSESGQTLMVVSLAIPFLLGFVGLAIDIGYVRYMKRQVQLAADAAALAGTLELTHGGDVTNAALTSVATDNAFPSVTQSTGCSASPTSGSSVVLVNNPPACPPSGATDPHAGNSNYVEVIVTRNVPTLFARIFGANSVSVSARAEAGLGSSSQCIYALAPTGTGILMNGTPTVDSQCGVIVDSSNSSSAIPGLQVQ